MMPPLAIGFRLNPYTTNVNSSIPGFANPNMVYVYFIAVVLLFLFCWFLYNCLLNPKQLFSEKPYKRNPFESFFMGMVNNPIPWIVGFSIFVYMGPKLVAFLYFIFGWFVKFFQTR
jgi:hypothetical protein